MTKSSRNRRKERRAQDTYWKLLEKVWVDEPFEYIPEPKESLVQPLVNHIDQRNIAYLKLQNAQKKVI